MAAFESDLALRVRTRSSTSDASLLNLPTELLLHILGWLEPTDLVKVAQTCRHLSIQSCDDQIWHPIINSCLAQRISSPGPARSFRDLYAAQHPNWFLPRGRIWFGDSLPSGKLLLARYNEEQGHIEAFAMAATRGIHTMSLWEKDSEVVVHSFEPDVSLDLSQPVLKLEMNNLRAEDTSVGPTSKGSQPKSLYSQDVLMDTFNESGLHSAFMLCRSLPDAAISEGTSVWPPQKFPASSRTRSESAAGFTSAGHRPSCYDEISQDTFRLRKWVEYTGRWSSPNYTSGSGISLALGMGMQIFAPGRPAVDGVYVRHPENVTTYSTLPEWCYTPTTLKPWRGIWVGDYSAHGCEFLVMTQPDEQSERPLPDGLDWLREWFQGDRRGSNSTEDSFSSAVEEQNDGGENSSSSCSKHPDDYDDVPTGRLEAIKLTGDPNIPRGEYTFIAPDIGHGGFVRIADEQAFRGARVVRSAGHIARRGFRDDEYTPSQLIMLSHDRLAQYWEETGHISYFQRVDLDVLTKCR